MFSKQAASPNLKGKKELSSTIGALMSLTIIVLLVILGSQKVTEVFTYGNVSHFSYVSYHTEDLNQINLYDNN